MNPDLRPTPLLPQEAKRPIPVAPVGRGLRGRSLTVVLGFLAFGLRSLWLSAIRRSSPREFAVRLASLLEDLGGLWVKVGQILSMRTDMFSPEVCDELSRLQYRTVGFPAEVARALIERELGRPIPLIFSRFDDTPFAAASIAQVHLATLLANGAEVVVKVQRPDAKEVFRRDMNLLKLVFSVYGKLPMLAHLRFDEALWELQRILKEETDYKYELSNLFRMRRLLKKHGIRVPKAYRRYCSERVLVMERIDGVPMTEFIDLQRRGDPRLQTWLAENDIRPRKVAYRLLASLLRQIMEDNLFHGDLHPGNILLLRNSRLALIDFGSIGTLEKDFRVIYARMLAALVEKDYSAAVQYTLRLTPVPPTADIAEIRQQMTRSYMEWEARIHLRDLPYQERSLASASEGAAGVLFRNKIPANWTFLRLSRSWSALDASLRFLSPRLSYTKIFRRYFEAAQRRNRRRTLARIREAGRAVAQAVTEYHNLVMPELRRRTLELQGIPSKVARAGAILLGFTSHLVLGALLILAGGFLVQHYPGAAARLGGDWLAPLVRGLPRLTFGQWILLLAAFALTFRTLRTLRGVSAQRELRL